MIHVVVSADRITVLSVFCTVYWDEAVQTRHAAQVHLTRP